MKDSVAALSIRSGSKSGLKNVLVTKHNVRSCLTNTKHCDTHFNEYAFEDRKSRGRLEAGHLQQRPRRARIRGMEIGELRRRREAENEDERETLDVLASSK